MVDAVRADYLGGDPDINTPNNLVVLDAQNRLPAADGSLITNIDAGNINLCGCGDNVCLIYTAKRHSIDFIRSRNE